MQFPTTYNTFTVPTGAGPGTNRVVISSTGSVCSFNAAAGVDFSEVCLTGGQVTFTYLAGSGFSSTKSGFIGLQSTPPPNMVISTPTDSTYTRPVQIGLYPGSNAQSGEFTFVCLDDTLPTQTDAMSVLTFGVLYGARVGGTFVSNNPASSSTDFAWQSIVSFGLGWGDAHTVDANQTFFQFHYHADDTLHFKGGANAAAATYAVGAIIANVGLGYAPKYPCGWVGFAYSPGASWGNASGLILTNGDIQLLAWTFTPGGGNNQILFHNVRIPMGNMT